MPREGARPTKRLGPPRTSPSTRSDEGSIVIDPGQLVFDLTGNALSIGVTGVVWAVLFLCAFEHPAFAESVGLGRRAFWLLLPGAVAATLADLPLLPISNDVLGISLAGAAFPLAVAVLALGRVAPPTRRSATVFLGAYGLVAASGLGIVVAFPAAVPSLVGVVAVAAVAPLAVWLAGRARNDELLRRVAGLLALTGGVMVLTFLFSSASAGVGITEGYPQYLLPPIAAGLLVGLAAPRLLGAAEALALPLAYIAGTFGVLVGADVLREPPLYPSTTPGFYVIGGAGILDLVYLGGLLAFAAAYGLHYALGRSWDPVPGAPRQSPPPTPTGQLGRALRQGVDGDLAGSLSGSALAARSGAREAALLLGVPTPPPDRPWQGLPVPGWVVSDQANLDAAAAQGTTDGRESYRGWLTARSLVSLSLDIARRRFATAGVRAWAFLVDLLVVTVPAVLVWVYLAYTVPGGLNGLLGSIAFNGAIYAYISLAYLYFVLAEWLYGTTVGKRLWGLTVRRRALQPPDLSSSLVRNAFRIPVLSVVGLTVASAVALLVATSAPTNVSFEGIPLPAGLLAAATLLVGAVLATGLLGLIGYLSIVATGERQRLGDLTAGTWVVWGTRGRSAAPAPAPAPGPGLGPSG